MTIDANLVRRMRAAQKEYFRLRMDRQARPQEQSDALARSKELEREVDRVLRDAEGGQGRLFGG